MTKNVLKTLGLSFLLASTAFSATIYAAEKNQKPKKLKLLRPQKMSLNKS